MSGFQQKLIASGLLVLALIFINIIAAHLPGQVDTTAKNAFSLSDGTRAMLENIEEPITLKFYYTRSVEDLPAFFRNYAERVERLLRQYEEAADGMIRLEIIDPEPNTDEEDEALRYGLANRMLATGDQIILGLVALQADNQEIIELFSMQREPFVELDISQLIYQVTLFEKPTVGIISSLNVISGVQQNFMPGQRQQPDWYFVEQLRTTYNVERVTGDEIPSTIDLLLVFHPQGVSNKLRFAIDQYLLEGNPVIVAVDPSSFYQRQQQNPQAMQMGMGGNVGSNLADIFAANGIAYDQQQVVGDTQLGNMIASPEGTPVMMPTYFTITDFREDSPIVGQFEEISALEAGSFFLEPEVLDRLRLERLLMTTDQGQEIMANTLQFTPPHRIGDQFLAGAGEVQTIAGIIRGTFKTAFPDGPPEDEDEDESEEDEIDNLVQILKTEEDEPDFLKESAEPGVMVVITDTDMFADEFSVQRYNFLGMQGAQPVNDNLFFLTNLVDFVAGSDDLLDVRSKGTVNRPFDLVEEMEEEARKKFDAEVEELESDIATIQEDIRAIQQREGGRSLMASPEILAKKRELDERLVELRRDLREIERRKTEDIQNLGTMLGFLNVFLMPAFIGLIGIVYFLKRSQRK